VVRPGGLLSSAGADGVDVVGVVDLIDHVGVLDVKQAVERPVERLVVAMLRATLGSVVHRVVHRVVLSRVIVPADGQLPDQPHDLVDCDRLAGFLVANVVDQPELIDHFGERARQAAFEHRFERLAKGGEPRSFAEQVTGRLVVEL
jgi:hypothetical protein